MSAQPIDIPNQNVDTAPTPQNTPAFTTSINQEPKVTADTDNIPKEALMGLLQGRLNTLIGASSGYIESLPKEVHDRVNALRAVQVKHTNLETEFHKELYALEKKYADLYEPLYQQRFNITSGSVEPTAEEIQIGTKIEAEENDGESASKIVEVDNNEGGEVQSVKGIPEFWSTAMKNHPRLAELITDRDSEALQYLEDISLKYLDDSLGFKIIFKFAENEFFENTQLIKTFYYTLEETPGSMTFSKAEGTTIAWKTDKDLSLTTETKKQRHKATNRVRVIKKIVPAETFFSFFETIDEETLTENPEEMERVEADYDLGEEFKDQIIPHAIDWFTGKALDHEGSEFDEDDYGEFDDDEEDDEEEDTDDDDDQSMSAKNVQNPPQCKQQ